MRSSVHILESSVSMLGMRKPKNSKAIIYSVYRYFDRESLKSMSRGQPRFVQRTAEANGYSEHTVRHIVSETN